MNSKCSKKNVAVILWTKATANECISLIIAYYISCNVSRVSYHLGGLPSLDEILFASLVESKFLIGLQHNVERDFLHYT
jgi:hypothetical protein